MGEGYEKYLEGDYDEGKEEEQREEDLAQAKAARATIEVTKIRLKNQLIGEEAQKKGMLRNRPGDLEEFYKDYVNREEEYLVDGAVLQCDQATWDDFPVPGGDPVVLEGDFDKAQKPRTTLRAYENPISDNGLIFATVSDTIKDINIIPFKCNCKIEADREAEIEAIKADKSCSRHGVCRHLMKLNSEWENVSLGGNSYLSKRDISGSIQVPNNYLQQVRYGIVENSSIAVEKEGLNMCSILFCKHGGIITPVNSGQNKFQEENGDLPEVDPTDPESVRKFIWAFFRKEGFSEYAVAGIIGNVYQETHGTFDPGVTKGTSRYGLFQWGGGRENELLDRGEEYEKQMGLPKGEGWKDVQLQCEYALDEYYMRTEGDYGWTSNRFNPKDRTMLLNSKINWDEEKAFVGTKDQFENAQSATDAALVWALSFERCVGEKSPQPEGKYSVFVDLQGLKDRITEAEKAYDDFANEY